MDNHIVAWTYEADIHCPDCAEGRWGEQGLRQALGDKGLEDREGNLVRPVYGWDSDDYITESCGDCHEPFDDAWRPGSFQRQCPQCEQDMGAASEGERRECPHCKVTAIWAGSVSGWDTPDDILMGCCPKCGTYNGRGDDGEGDNCECKQCGLSLVWSEDMGWMPPGFYPACRWPWSALE